MVVHQMNTLQNLGYPGIHKKKKKEKRWNRFRHPQQVPHKTSFVSQRTSALYLMLWHNKFHKSLITHIFNIGTFSMPIQTPESLDRHFNPSLSPGSMWSCLHLR